MVTNNAWNSQDPAQVAKGGTGANTLTDHGVLVGSGTSAITALSVGTTGQLLVGSTTADPAFGSSANADFTFTSSTAASTRTLTVTNTDNTSTTSHAQILAETGGSSGGDPFVRVSVSGGQDYSFGIDNTSSDALLITDDANPSTGNTLWKMTSAGENTMPLQPAFLGYISSSLTNVTGDGTTYTVIYDSERFDQNSDFNTGTGTFTAPVTGKYQLNTEIAVSNLAAGHTAGFIEINTSNANYRGNQYNPVGVASSGATTYCASVTADMDAADTAITRVRITGSTKTVTVAGDGTNYSTNFSGFLAC